MTLLWLFANLCIFLSPAFVVAVGARQLSRRSRDAWRVLAFAPVLPLVYWGLRIARDVTADRTSHNLWPFELVGYGVVTLGLVGLFLVGRWLAGGALPRAGDSPRTPGSP